MDSIRLLGYADEIEHTLFIPPYHRVFTIDESCFEELITKFYASFEFYRNDVMFQLGGEMRRLMMQEFEVALGLWIVEFFGTSLQTSLQRYLGGHYISSPDKLGTTLLLL